MNKDIHEMRLPRKVVVGESLIGRLRDIDESLTNSMNVLVLTSIGPFQRIEERFMEGWDSDQKVRAEMVGEASIPEVERLVGVARSDLFDIILGMGGGRVIDLAKMTAYHLNKDFVSVPTAASHDGISSQLASIKGGNRAYSYVTKPPESIIVDIDVITGAPSKLTASGVGDVISKIIAVRDWRLAHLELGEYYGDYAAQLALMSADTVMNQVDGIGRMNKNSIRTLVEALISAGVASGIAGSSRPCSGSEHLFSHALDIYSNEHALHGEQCGVGSIMMAFLHGLNHVKIAESLSKAGAPTNAQELGISEKNIVEALVKARTIRPGRYTILNARKMDESRARMIAKETGVIG